jgi:5-methylthioadenosine/S-adenosylhomocysteine deaminase
MPVLIRNAHVLTMDAADTQHVCADILIEASRIAAIGVGLVAPDGAEIIEAKGMLAMPGLINAHVHSPANFMRGTLDGLPLELFMLYEVPPLSERAPTKRMTYVRTMLGAMEMLELGITSVMDDAFHVPVPTPDTIDGVMEAYRDAGIRATATLDQPNVVEYEKYPFLAELLPDAVKARMDDAPVASVEHLLELYDYLIGRWHGEAKGRLAAGMSCSAPHRVKIACFEALSALSQAHDLPFVVHVLETKLQRVFGNEKLGKSLVRYVDDLGLLDERMQVVHAIWVDDGDMRILAKAGCTIAHDPVCNLKLGSGIMPFRALRDHGIPICLGTDEAVADDTHNLWQTAKMAGLVHKIADPEYRNWPSAGEILDCVFRGGARAMRLEETIGQIAVGGEADLILLDLDTFAFTPLNDIRRQLVYCENGSSVRLTMVAGDIVMRDGLLLNVDERAIRAEARVLMAECVIDFAGADAAARELDPFYRAMYLKAAAQDVGRNRWAHLR